MRIRVINDRNEILGSCELPARGNAHHIVHQGYNLVVLYLWYYIDEDHNVIAQVSGVEPQTPYMEMFVKWPEGNLQPSDVLPEFRCAPKKRKLIYITNTD